MKELNKLKNESKSSDGAMLFLVIGMIMVAVSSLVIYGVLYSLGVNF